MQKQIEQQFNKQITAASLPASLEKILAAVTTVK